MAGMAEEALEGDRIRIETPEHVVFEYELAGLVSRIMAALMYDAVTAMGAPKHATSSLLPSGCLPSRWSATWARVPYRRPAQDPLVAASRAVRSVLKGKVVTASGAHH